MLKAIHRLNNTLLKIAFLLFQAQCQATGVREFVKALRKKTLKKQRPPVKAAPDLLLPHIGGYVISLLNWFAGFFQ